MPCTRYLTPQNQPALSTLSLSQARAIVQRAAGEPPHTRTSKISSV